MHIELIGNYPPDRQESMERFAVMMRDTLAGAGLSVGLIRPGVVLGGRIGDPRRGLGKWLGYVDKFILFPVGLWLRLARLRCRHGNVIVHIADHSNALYALALPRRSTAVTCHDMLAVRAGLGEAGTGCEASATGRVFQRLIRRGLMAAGKVACVSRATWEDFVRLVPRSHPGDVSVAPNALNGDFAPLPLGEAAAILRDRLPFVPAHNYMFHIGSDLPRKNRATVVAAFAHRRRAGWDGWLVFAGAGATADVTAEIARHGMADRVVFAGKITHAELNALYSAAQAFVFPSISEGFGWPPVEAQASGCPVLASNTTSLPEVCGEGAQLFDPMDAAGFAAGLAKLDDPEVRRAWMEKGRANAARFTREAMAAAYRAIYAELGGR